MSAWRITSMAVFVASAVFSLQAVAGESVDLSVASWQGRTMGSPYRIQIVDGRLTDVQIASLKDEIDARLNEINRQMSNYIPDSELSQFNRSPANTPFKVSPEFARVMRFTIDLCSCSNGALDPTLAPVIDLWGFGAGYGKRNVPPDAAIEAAMKKTGWRHLSVTASDELIKDIPELSIDLGAVAKGFAVDEMIRVLQAHELMNVYASIAGEVRVLGHNGRGTAWQIGISSPIDHWNESDSMAAATALSNQALSTSGDYHKFFYDSQGRRWCHLLNPRTGKPVQSDIGSVSVIAPDSMTADALGTILFVLGLEKGMAFLESWPEAAALFIVREPDGQFRQIASPNFFSLTGNSL